ncbi:hypothetical protein ANCCAN_28688 [Ancylostoma caninum]|uniref:Uncharacterized protein n=1 Tax=Ancylostoma caninum TaxID=29170 RepID=A0A368F1S0_ANCCA|nr:hypothetical protein ANCCAN_28688 [Ancylostoma caninum]
MVPNFGTEISNGVLDLRRDNLERERYIEFIRHYLEGYKKEQLSRASFTKQCSSLEKVRSSYT